MNINPVLVEPTVPSVFSTEALWSFAIYIFASCMNTLKQKLAFIFNIPQQLSNIPFISNLLADSEPASHNIRPRIDADACCICLCQINWEVASTCGHIFCGKCVIDLWEAKNKQKLKCPLDRREIPMLIINFNENGPAQTDPVAKTIVESVRLYNVLFSNQPRSVKQMILDAPYLLRRFSEFIRTRDGWIFLVKKILGCLYICLLLIYIISPLDLIPDYLPIVGWIDDFIVIFYVLLYISILYFDFLRGR